MHKRILLRNRIKLITNLNCGDNFLAILKSEGIFNIYNVEQLSVINNKFDRNRSFLDLLPRRGPCAFNTFLKAALCDNQDIVFNILSLSLQHEILSGSADV